jgi:oligopeptide transport system permease protein
MSELITPGTRSPHSGPSREAWRKLPTPGDADDSMGLYEDGLSEQDFQPLAQGDHDQRLSRPSLSYWQDAWMRLKKNRQALASLAVVIALALFTLAGPYLWRVSPADQDLSRISETPSLRKQALVINPPESWDGVVVANHPAAPEAPGTELPAPTSIEMVGIPSGQSVRLKWTPVTGAAGYMVYRSEKEPDAYTNLGVPIGQVDAGNKVSYEDTFNLERSTYFYSVVPMNGGESQSFVTVRVDIPNTITLDNAQRINPDAKVGQTLVLEAHPMGTDYLGRDMLARLMAGARVSLFIGFFAPVFEMILALLLGGWAGYAGGKIDAWLMRFADFVLALPFLLFMILFKIAFGIGPGESGIMPMLIAMVLLSWPGPGRLVRGQIIQLRESEFVQASRLLGARPTYLLARHLLPNTLGVILVSLTFAIPSAIFTEAFLSFIGMGVVPPVPSWGSMCNDGVQTFLTHPHEFLFPAILISITVLAFNLLGDGLRDALDPRLRGKG